MKNVPGSYQLLLQPGNWKGSNGEPRLGVASIGPHWLQFSRAGPIQSPITPSPEPQADFTHSASTWAMTSKIPGRPADEEKPKTGQKDLSSMFVQHSLKSDHKGSLISNLKKVSGSPRLWWDLILTLSSSFNRPVSLVATLSDRFFSPHFSCQNDL